MTHDIRFAFRQLLKSPGFSFVAILTVAYGIGANTTMYSLVKAVLWRPLPFREPGRLVWIANPNLGAEGIPGLTSQANLRDWRKLNHSFEDLAAYLPSISDRVDFTLSGKGESVRVKSVVASRNLLDVLGIQPLLGRDFTVEECQPNGPRGILLTHYCRKQRFHMDPGIVGKSITLNNLSWNVVGILPASFDFSSIFAPGSQPVDFLRPHPELPGYDNWGNIMAVIGRLKPGLSVLQAQTDLATLNHQLQSAYPERGRFGAHLVPLREHVVGKFRRPLLVLSCAVGFLLLIACANLSNLLLARFAARKKEIAIRTALGASRWRLLRHTLAESALLSGFGAALGLLLAHVATNALAQTQAFRTPLLATAHVDKSALVFTILLTAATSVAFGIVPAIQLLKAAPLTELKETSRGSGHGRRRVWAREMLVVLEVALTCVLLVGAGLLMRSFVQLLAIDPGFRPQGTAAWRIQPTRDFATRQSESIFYAELLHRVQELPGIESASLTDKLPMDLNDVLHVRAKGQTYRQSETPSAFVRFVHPGYFATMRIPMVAGRDFGEHDSDFDWHEPAQKLAIINRKLARALWPGMQVLGQLVVLDGPPDPPAECRVIGVVGDVRQSALEQAPGPEIYVIGGGHYLVVRAKGRWQTLVGPVTRVLRESDPTMAAPEVRPLTEIVNGAVASRQLITLSLGLFSLSALLLASLGIYGVIAFSVSQRTQEIGIRLALGSTIAAVLRLIIREGMTLVLLGSCLGLAGALALSRMMQALLFGVSPSDPLTFLSSSLLAAIVGLAACWLPAIRASHVNPVVALRCD